MKEIFAFLHANQNLALTVHYSAGFMTEPSIIITMEETASRWKLQRAFNQEEIEFFTLDYILKLMHSQFIREKKKH